MISPAHKIAIFGSTGSIGQQTLDIIRRHREQFEIIALIAHNNVEPLIEQCVEFEPQYIGINDEKKIPQVKQLLSDHNLHSETLAGSSAIAQFAGSVAYDTMVAGITGSAGLASIYQAVCNGKRILLANKECLVMAGHFIIEQARQNDALLIPVDSEHNALFQCLNATALNDDANVLNDVVKVILTASGGPFLHTPLDQLSSVSPKQAYTHPNWKMGQKISVDSATMMNKGLEVIEAHWLFGLPASQIDVLIHPQSIVHGLVNLRDGTVLTQMAQPDMRIPIANALAWPERIDSGAEMLDLAKSDGLEFFAPDYARFPCLQLAYQAVQAGMAQTTALNAVNEVAVQAFLEHKIQFTDIYAINQQILNGYKDGHPCSIEDILMIDEKIRRQTQELIAEK